MTIKPIPTRSDQVPNGWLLTIWNEHEQDWRPAQIYLTVVAPGATKGPHLHARRCGRFLCVKGDVVIVTRDSMDGGGKYTEHRTGETAGFDIVEVPPGTPAQIRNLGAESAYVLNMPSPAWSKDDQDEWPVEGWDPR